MFQKVVTTELTRRVAAYYLLFCVTAAGSCGALLLVNGYTQFAAIGAMALCGVGLVVVYRTVRPLAEVDAQLREVARAASLADVHLQPVPIHAGAAVGWNRLVELRQQDQAGSLDERLSAAVAELNRNQADDLLNSFPDGVAVTDADGRITLANDALAAMIGAAGRDALQGQSILAALKLFPDADDRRTPLDAAFPSRDLVAEIDWPNGDEVACFRVARHPLRGRPGRARAGHVWTVRDVSQQKQVDQMRDQFLDAATHELRTPLANIRAYSETLQLTEVADVEQQKEFCNIINAEATRLGRIIDELLTVSSMEAGSLTLNRQNVHFGRLLEETLDKVRPQMEQKNIALESLVPQKLPELNLDKDKIVAALVNLLGNAAKYTPASGRVVLRVLAGDDHLQVDVEDTGVGISAEELPNVFDKFFRGSDGRIQNETGSGLGLSFAREVVRLHNGSLTVASELNKGSTFTMRLPLP